MNKDTIITGLMRALENGNGNLDDLNALLDRVKIDIATVKREEEEAEQKRQAEIERKHREEMEHKRQEEERAQGIAALATRLLNNELTSDDVAMVLNSFFNSKGETIKFNSKDIDEMVGMSHELNNTISNFAKTLSDIFDTITDLNDNKKIEDKKSAVKSSDDEVIDNFLKKLGIR